MRQVCPDSGDDEGYIWEKTQCGPVADRIPSHTHALIQRQDGHLPRTIALTRLVWKSAPGQPGMTNMTLCWAIRASFLPACYVRKARCATRSSALSWMTSHSLAIPSARSQMGRGALREQGRKSFLAAEVPRKAKHHQQTEKSLTPDRSEWAKRPVSSSSWLQTFHFVLVLDRPDPYSSTSGTVWKYFNTIYEHIAFTFTAVLYQEQVLHNFVERECDALGSLKDDYMRRGW